MTDKQGFASGTDYSGIVFPVMKKIAALNAIPEDGQYKFTDRATTMMSKVRTTLCRVTIETVH